MVKWTKEQEEAIYTEGSDILVAAAAGSGKTAVLVERIIRKLVSKQNPIDIDELLVVTFTNAAAQEMRNRVGSALEEALAADPASNHLKKQLSLLQSASISTLHSFCMDIVRQYAYLIDIDPVFRIANDMEAELMKQDIIAQLFEEKYGASGEEQDSFFQVVDRFSSDRSDAAVESLILQLYTFSIQNPWPERWLESLSEVYYVEENWRESQLTWLSIIKKEAQIQFNAMMQEIERALKLTQESDGPYQYAEALEADSLHLQQASAYLDSWEDLQAYMTTAEFKQLSRKKVECNEEKKEKVKVLRDRYRKRWNNLKNKLFSRDLESHLQDMREHAPVIKTLTELVKQFKERFTEQKKKQAIVDFSDLEHYCLQLLTDPSSTVDNIVPSSVAWHLKNRYRELLVDEYQDTNLVQETILTLISDQVGAGNMFMVGDVKQSIYRFRHAEPTLFIEKYKRFRKSPETGIRIDLARNFRSREHVLTGANYIFRQILDEAVGEIQYDKQAELIYSNKMYDPFQMDRPEPELLIIDREANEEKESDSNVDEAENFQDLEKAQLEARLYAKKVKEWTGNKSNAPLQIVNKATESQRDLQYRDIVILLRSMTWAPTIVDELKKQGIPVYAELATGYFEAIEIKIMLSFLKIIDNPRQDIPMVSVLRSPIIGLNEDELASIRLADRSSSYFDALEQYNKQNTDSISVKIDRFLEQLTAFRSAARQGALSELIWQIYRTTGFYDFVGGMPGGRQRQANLRALYDRARGYEKTSLRGLFRFLRFVERMEERGDDLGSARALSEQEDVVRIMTVHKSKGLEFPVVILGGMDREFNMQDLKQSYLLDKDYGFASKYIDPVKRITYPTLYYHAMQMEKRRQLLAEEMRVLYVALTRAKEKMVMVGNVASIEKKQEKWIEMIDHSDWVLPAHFRADAKTYLDWVGPALVRHEQNEVLREDENIPSHVLADIKVDPSRWNVSIIHGSELANPESTQTEANTMLKETVMQWTPLQLQDESLKRRVNDRLSYEYPFKEATASRAKQTVTELKRQREIKDAYSSDQLITTFQTPIMNRPQFMQKEKSLSSVEKGTAMHTVMQNLPFNRPLTNEEIEGFVQSYVEREILTEEEAKSIQIAAIERFFTTDIAEQMMKTPDFMKEVPFSYTLNASDIYASWTNEADEPVLIQGVIDCLIPVDGKWVILDYKTDAIQNEVTQEVKQQLIKKYAVQMDLYKQAVESILREPVKDVYLYFFAKDLLINVTD
ncbi:helicase-exonuclease AddAB subunit AddA [Virgibacillus sp. W0181]|uniref:helicase-exonuclease AddAB subunit AddA n=1 Tax=Virgibacillus sp. W0181 TaxID=3391581 RepID=UPI003F470020